MVQLVSRFTIDHSYTSKMCPLFSPHATRKKTNSYWTNIRTAGLLPPTGTSVSTIMIEGRHLDDHRHLLLFFYSWNVSTVGTDF